MADSNAIISMADLGYGLGPQVLESVLARLDEQQQALARQYPRSAADLSYGVHERHRLDLYQPADDVGQLAPVLLFVHGGGFLKGDKGDDKRWHNGSVGRMAARGGLLGAVMNYRLAPEHTWPSGGEDVGAAVDWLKANAREYGGDPQRIFLVGTSAGAVHVATYLKLRPGADEIRGAVMMSGLYGFTPLDERDCLYYGPQDDYAERCPMAAVTATKLPLLIACAEFDPPRFQAETLGLLQARLQAHGHMPQAAIISAHNHYSLASHLGTADTRLEAEILRFITLHSK